MGTFISLHGHALGFDSITGAIQRPGLSSSFENDESVTAASTAASLKWRGAATINSTSTSAYTLLAPVVAGLSKLITSINASTIAKTVALASGNFLSTAGSTATTLTFNGAGQNVTLTALSTALVQISANAGVTIS